MWSTLQCTQEIFFQKRTRCRDRKSTCTRHLSEWKNIYVEFYTRSYVHPHSIVVRLWITIWALATPAFVSLPSIVYDVHSLRTCIIGHFPVRLKECNYLVIECDVTSGLPSACQLPIQRQWEFCSGYSILQL